jgi:hypothetical protein
MVPLPRKRACGGDSPASRDQKDNHTNYNNVTARSANDTPETERRKSAVLTGTRNKRIQLIVLEARFLGNGALICNSSNFH